MSSLEDLKKRLSLTENEKNEKIKDNAVLVNHIKKLDTEKQTNEKLIQDFRKKNEKLKENNSVLTIKKEELMMRVSNFIEEKKEIEANCTNKISEITGKKNEELLIIQKENDILQNKLDQFIDKNDKKNVKNEGNKEEYDVKVKELMGKVEVLVNERNDLSDMLKNEKEIPEVLRHKVSELIDVVKNLNEKKDELTKRNKDLGNEIEKKLVKISQTLKTTEISQEEEKEIPSTKISEPVEVVKDLNVKKDELTKKKEILENEIEKKQNKTEVQSDDGEGIKEVEKQIPQVLRSQISKLIDSVKDLNDERVELTKTIESQKKKQLDDEKESKEILDGLRQQISNLIDVIKDLNEKQSELKNVNDGLATEIDDKTFLKKKIYDEILLILEMLPNENNNVTKVNFDEKMDNVRQLIINIKKRIEDLTEENINLKEIHSKSIKEKEFELEKSKDLNNSLKVTIEEFTNENNKLIKIQLKSEEKKELELGKKKEINNSLRVTIKEINNTMKVTIKEMEMKYQQLESKKSLKIEYEKERIKIEKERISEILKENKVLQRENEVLKIEKSDFLEIIDNLEKQKEKKEKRLSKNTVEFNLRSKVKELHKQKLLLAKKNNILKENFERLQKEQFNAKEFSKQNQRKIQSQIKQMLKENNSLFNKNKLLLKKIKFFEERRKTNYEKNEKDIRIEIEILEDHLSKKNKMIERLKKRVNYLTVDLSKVKQETEKIGLTHLGLDVCSASSSPKVNKNPLENSPVGPSSYRLRSHEMYSSMKGGNSSSFKSKTKRM